MSDFTGKNVAACIFSGGTSAPGGTGSVGIRYALAM